MRAKLIDGKKVSENIRYQVRKDIVDGALTPGLAIVLVGNDPASLLYVSLKEKACNEVGIDFHKYLLEEQVTQHELEDTIDYLNNDKNINGIVLQLPLPSHLDEDYAIARIAKDKDADGFGPENLVDFMNHEALIIPALPHGIYELIKETGVKLQNKSCVVIANSQVFAIPIINMMNYKDVNAVYVNPDDEDLIQKTLNADIVIIAIGRKWFLDQAMVKKNSIIIDVGTNREGNVTYGDVNPNVDDTVSWRSPVPGGVGPMTIAMLLLNTILLYKKQKS